MNIADSGWFAAQSLPPLPSPLPRGASREERATWSVTRFLNESAVSDHNKVPGSTATDPAGQLQNVTQTYSPVLLSRDKDTATRLERMMTYLNHPQAIPPRIDLHQKTAVLVTADQSTTGKITTFTVAGGQHSEIRDLVAIPVHPRGDHPTNRLLTQETCTRPFCRNPHMIGVGFNVFRTGSTGRERLCPIFLAVEPTDAIAEVTQGWANRLDLPQDWLFTLMITAYAMLTVALHQDTPWLRAPMSMEKAITRGRNIIHMAQTNKEVKSQNRIVGGMVSAWKGANEDLRLCDWDTNLLEAVNRTAEDYPLDGAMPNRPAPDRLVLFTNMERGYLFHSVAEGIDVESILFGRLHRLEAHDDGEPSAELFPGEGDTLNPAGEKMDACILPTCKAPHLLIVVVALADPYGLDRMGHQNIAYAPLTLATSVPDVGVLMDRLDSNDQVMDTAIRESVAWLCVALQFLGGKITRSSRHKARYSRHWRRNLETDPIPPPEEYQVVELRPIEYVNKPGTTGEPVTVDWQVSWIVRRHTRRQWYPSERLWRNIIIEPYRKGPDDKPLVHANKMFAVTR